MSKTDFYIDRAPVSISFTCPCCENDVTIPWKQLDPPDYWWDKWKPVNCPDCGKKINLGDWEFN